MCSTFLAQLPPLSVDCWYLTFALQMQPFHFNNMKCFHSWSLVNVFKEAGTICPLPNRDDFELKLLLSIVSFGINCVLTSKKCSHKILQKILTTKEGKQKIEKVHSQWFNWPKAAILWTCKVTRFLCNISIWSWLIHCSHFYAPIIIVEDDMLQGSTVMTCGVFWQWWSGVAAKFDLRTC